MDLRCFIQTHQEGDTGAWMTGSMTSNEQHLTVVLSVHISVIREGHGLSELTGRKNNCQYARAALMPPECGGK